MEGLGPGLPEVGSPEPQPARAVAERTAAALSSFLDTYVSSGLRGFYAVSQVEPGKGVTGVASTGHNRIRDL